MAKTVRELIVWLSGQPPNAVVPLVDWSEQCAPDCAEFKMYFDPDANYSVIVGRETERFHDWEDRRGSAVILGDG